MTLQSLRSGQEIRVEDTTADKWQKAVAFNPPVREVPARISRHERLRVALITGKLGLGGAEKQLVYMARGLLEAGVDVGIYSLTSGHFYERELQARGLKPRWVGRFANPCIRLGILAGELARYRPHIVQAAQFYTNLYATLAGRLCNAVVIGSLRTDITFEMQRSRRWGRVLLRMPASIIANSYTANFNARQFGIEQKKIHVVPNVIDIAAFDAYLSQRTERLATPDQVVAMAVGRLVRVKRFDRFLSGLSQARKVVAGLKGVIVGNGPERAALERMAGALGLLPEGVVFLGARNDVPTLLRQADLLVLCSDYEGLPNVLLEAMTARLPVITTPAGDAGIVVRNDVTGYVVPFESIERIAECLIRLATAPALRRQLGESGRHRVEQQYSRESLAVSLLSVYHAIARQHNNYKALSILDALMMSDVRYDNQSLKQARSRQQPIQANLTTHATEKLSR